MAARQYVGITIGPIFDTIVDAAKPAALWFASTMFSDISRRLCFSIHQLYKEYTSFQLYAPFIDEKDKDALQGGIGKYHDRIIFSVEEEQGCIKDNLDKIIETVKENTILIFGDELFDSEQEKINAKMFLMKYLQINYVILDAEKDLTQEQLKDGCLLFVSPYLDTLELMGVVPRDNKDNPIGKLFYDKGKNSNKYITQSYLMTEKAKDNICVQASGDRKYAGIKSIEDISGVNTNSAYKYTRYFAVVNADGDFVGRLLKSLNEDEISLFSKGCFAYNEKAVELIVKFGGLPIYAGGDDLLFLAPVMNGDQTIFELCSRIADMFKMEIKACFPEDKAIPLPTLSFGISIQYYKYPLYEALKTARELLGKYSKRQTWDDKSEKNCMSVKLSKHSGQSISFAAGNEFVPALDEFLAEIKHYSLNQDQMLKGIGTTLENFYHLVTQIDRRYTEGKTIDGALLWDNLFDNQGQQESKKFQSDIQQFYYGHLIDKKAKLQALTTMSEDFNNKQLNALLSILRLGKFLIEKGER